MPGYLKFVGTDSTNGVYGLYANGSREYSHIVTFPTLFNQDILLKEMIDNLTARTNNLNSKNGENFLTYVCWAWTLLTMALCIGYIIYKVYLKKYSE